jgi:ERF superfamily
MQASEQIDELATALARAQGEITGALKDSANPFFKSKYSDLASCWDACRAALSKNGLAVTQFPMTDPTGTYLVTSLLHSSGQWMRSNFALNPKDDSSQAVGSAITYARRYALCAVVGVAQIDDDGNAASGRSEGHSPKGDLGKGIPLDHARSVALEMLAIIDKPAADGDHDEVKKALEALDYHERVLNPDEDLYVAVGEQLPAAKRNVWKALISKARNAEKADRQVANAGRKF